MSKSDARKALKSTKAVFEKAFATGDCAGCGKHMFMNETHANIFILNDRSVIHVCDKCLKKTGSSIKKKENVKKPSIDKEKIQSLIDEQLAIEAMKDIQEDQEGDGE